MSKLSRSNRKALSCSDIFATLSRASQNTAAHVSVAISISGDQEDIMELGAFSISLDVKDIAVSRAFYENLGFTTMGGDEAQNWLILKNGTTVIGLFQGMFKKNMLTFNPGWDQDAKALKRFTDIRQLQAELQTKGVPLESEVDETGSGPGSFTVVDPDGNPILVDQHV
ncbi:MAG: VOC family protein [Hyphomicrobiales bacterium]